MCSSPPAGGALEPGAERLEQAVGGQEARSAGLAREGWARQGGGWCQGLRNSGRERGGAGPLWETPQPARSQTRVAF